MGGREGGREGGEGGREGGRKGGEGRLPPGMLPLMVGSVWDWPAATDYPLETPMCHGLPLAPVGPMVDRPRCRAPCPRPLQMATRRDLCGQNTLPPARLINPCSMLP